MKIGHGLFSGGLVERGLADGPDFNTVPFRYRQRPLTEGVRDLLFGKVSASLVWKLAGNNARILW